MDKTIVFTFRVCSFIATTILLMSASGAYSQNAQSIDSIAKVSSWIDKDLTEKMKANAEWQGVKAQYDASNAELHRLEVEKRTCEERKNELINRQKELQRNLSALVSGGKGKQENKMFSPCDTTILLFHQGLYGDSVLENRQKVLVACLRAERVLSVPYDEEAVGKSLKILESAKKYFPEESSKLSDRIQQYGEMTETLRQALTAADTLDKLDLDKELVETIRERYAKRFMDKLEEKLDPQLLNPNDYPYLYGILTKALATIMEDPRKSISELIDKL